MLQAPPAFANAILPVAGSGNLTSVTCPGAHLCIGVGATPDFSGAVYVKILPSDPDVRSARLVPGITGGAAGVSCPTSSICEVVGADAAGVPVIVPVNVSTNTIGTPVEVPDATYLDGIACPTSTLCEAIGTVGTFGSLAAFASVTVASDGTPTVSPVATDTGEAALYDIDCPTTSTCWATGPGYGGGALVRLNPSTNSVVDETLVDNTTGLTGIQCRSTSDCVVVGYGGSDGDKGVVVSVTGATVGATELDSHVGELFDVACPSDTTCEASTDSGEIVPIDQGLPLEGTPPTVTGADHLYAIACPTSTTCERVGATGSEGVVAHQGVIVDSSPNFPDGTTCPTSGSVGQPRFSDATAKLGGGFGGVYATIGSAPVCRDPHASPPTSSWVMLQVPGSVDSTCSQVSSLCFAQAGIYYDNGGADHPFVEFNYPGFTTYTPPNPPDPNIDPHNAIEFPAKSVPAEATFGVLVQGPTTSATNCSWVKNLGKTAAYRQYQGAVPTGGSALQMEATLNGSCLWIFYVPLTLDGQQFAADLQWANLAGESGSATALTPGTYTTPLSFVNPRIYYAGGWQNFDSDRSGTAGNPRKSQAATLDYPVIQPTNTRMCHLASPTAGADWVFYTWTPSTSKKCDPWAN